MPQPQPPSFTRTTLRCRSPELAAEVATEIRLLRTIQTELAAHAAAREQHYLQAGPDQLARSLPGFAEISAPVLIAAMGRPGRFRDGTKFKSYVGLAPKASETGETDHKGQSMSKAGPSLLRATFYRAADTARRQDPQLAKIYHTRWPNAAPITSRPAASSPGTSPNAPGPSCTAAHRM